MAEGLSSEDATQVAREDFLTFRPAFVNGRRRPTDAAGILIRAEEERSNTPRSDAHSSVE
jgi:hypothetical protein